ncbi:MAG: hypothetical protein GY828_02880 [Candidatus Gracilibacteria bacterium]|nr:hypothetical protein [Candidatus Gracilibacteria bacterium]
MEKAGNIPIEHYLDDNLLKEDFITQHTLFLENTQKTIEAIHSSIIKTLTEPEDLLIINQHLTITLSAASIKMRELPGEFNHFKELHNRILSKFTNILEEASHIQNKIKVHQLKTPLTEDDNKNPYAQENISKMFLSEKTNSDLGQGMEIETPLFN